MKAGTLFKALADETRLRSLVLLARCGELCVCELTQALGVSQPKMSRHLAILRTHGLVAQRREGLWVFYRLHPDLPGWARAALESTAEGLRGQEPFAADAQRATSLAGRAICGGATAPLPANARDDAPGHLVPLTASNRR